MQYSAFLYVSSLSPSFCGWFRVRAATEVGFPCTVFVSMVMLTGVACTRGANAWSKPPESMFQRSAAGGWIHRETDDRLEQSGVQLDIKLNSCYLAVGLEEWEITSVCSYICLTGEYTSQYPKWEGGGGGGTQSLQMGGGGGTWSTQPNISKIGGWVGEGGRVTGRSWDDWQVHHL